MTLPKPEYVKFFSKLLKESPRTYQKMQEEIRARQNTLLFRKTTRPTKVLDHKILNEMQIVLKALDRIYQLQREKEVLHEKSSQSHSGL